MKKTRTEKKDANKEVWFDYKEIDPYKEGLKERYKIEREFGEAKQGHGFSRCRYIETTRIAIQTFLTAMVLNFKCMVKKLTEVNFKGRAYAAD